MGQEGTPGGLWLTKEPDGRLSRGLLWAPQVQQGLLQVLVRSAAVLCQLERVRGNGGKDWCRLSPLAGQSLHPGLAFPARTPTTPSQQPAGAGVWREQRAGCCPGSCGATLLPKPSWAGAPSAPPGSGRERSPEKSPWGRTLEGKERVWAAGWQRWAAAVGRGTAASPTHWALGAGGLSRLGLGLWGHPYQALADRPYLLPLQQLPELPVLQELGSSKQGFLRGLQSSRDREMAPLPRAQDLRPLHLGKAQGLSWALVGRRSSWGTLPAAASVPRQRRGASPISGTGCCQGSRTEVPQSCCSVAKARRRLERCSP